jgi:polyhydroxybutyrate depolymerase
VPANFQAGSSALIIGLHGSSGSGAEFQSRSQLSAKADEVGFAVAYPYALVSLGDGITEWNEFFNKSIGSNPPDDVGFIRQLINELQTSVNPDPKQIFVTGLSNGGFMAHRVGIQISDLVAAICVVEGTVVSPRTNSECASSARPGLGPDFSRRPGSHGALLRRSISGLAGTDL